ncbi:hypothetical protein WICMUC_004656 [Wickerhamomyces mucosus]|uniref:CID domain-containing protein n=1 Tax=Wickerhamomyces mucosus TaxID=1378264 RepID=A0A9P8TA91_9ASCO|nr:hypothetical protein WICMUC_004656 [Wickerhamomyces mucosus]
MDPFEARLQFIQLLETLTPSTLAIQKTISYALKNHELHEDFHSVILEKLEHLDLNSRLNILHFIESLITVIVSNNDQTEKPYIKNFEKDLLLIYEKLIPTNNLINLTQCVESLKSIEQKYNFDSRDLFEKFNSVDSKSLTNESNNDIQNLISNTENTFEKSWWFLILMKRKSLQNRVDQIQGMSEVDENPNYNFTKDQILSRIESDRERHKKFKESNWIINRVNLRVDREEFDKIWDQYNELNDDDYQDLQELNEIVNESYQI